MIVIASIEDPLVVKKILPHLRGKRLLFENTGLPGSRALPQDHMFSRHTMVMDLPREVHSGKVRAAHCCPT